MSLDVNSKDVVQRKRLKIKLPLEQQGHNNEAQAPSIFIGSIGSGNTVIKTREDRSTIATSDDLIAFEMESPCVGDEVSGIVVNAVCDYADSLSRLYIYESGEASSKI
ncbi:hypothetical protein BDV34DRAFT_229977 [Aspergillus parasiticus]|uniref:Uncharacterized protein n=1 Tax=Aspergillus parasiticus TaxID=5067 RepID=A0A5N6D6A0_ASPPA|nr:hypothetical protein BDV34DRAFT_229977 [Aspergillus parasiticus]